MKAMFDVQLLGSSNWMKFLTFTMLCAVWAMVGVFVHVGKQAETDQVTLANIGEQQVLSQRVAKYALAAAGGDADSFGLLAGSRERFAGIIDVQRTEFRVQPGSGGTPLQQGFDSLDSSWRNFSRNVDTVLGGQTLILSVAEAAAVMSEVMPQVLEYTGEMVGLLVKGDASPAQVSRASRQAVLGQRILNNANKVITGDEAAATVAAFTDDTAEFKRVLEGMLHGRKGIPAVSGSAAKAKLREIVALFDRASSHVAAVVDNSGELVSVQTAARAVAAESEQLFTTAVGFRKAYATTIEDRFVTTELAYLLGAVALFILLWMGFEALRNQKRRSKVVEDENSRTQDAIMRLLDEMGNLAEGDLTVHATVTEDFTGSIADSINVTVDSLRDLVKTINDTSMQLSSSAQETEEVAEQLSRASDNQSRDISTASQAINAMASSINEVSDNASESSKVAMSSVQIAKNGGEAVQRTIEGMDNIREHIQETSKRIKRLGESSQEIGDIVELINDIAEQTNILALNASIQAAMAGEAGRGFAVVADEVQRLAERSASATKQIEALVKTIQADTNEAVISMEKSTSGVVNGAQLAEDAGGALEEIESVSEQLAALIQTISSSARQQAEAAADISTTMNVIQDATTQTASGTERTSQSIGNLSRLSRDLDTSVAGFKLPR